MNFHKPFAKKLKEYTPCIPLIFFGICVTLCISRQLFSLRSFYRASISASSAVNAFVSVDNILTVYFGDTFCGASVCASAAADAFIIDLVCHFTHLHNIFRTDYIT